jgi:hypothetical protein
MDTRFQDVRDVAYEGRRRIYRAAADELGAMRGEMHGVCLRSTPALIHVPSGSRTTARSSRSRRSTPRSGTNACRACARSKARRRASLRKPRRSCASTTVERCTTSFRVRSRRRRTSCPQVCADPEGECACTPFPRTHTSRPSPTETRIFTPCVDYSCALYRTHVNAVDVDVVREPRRRVLARADAGPPRLLSLRRRVDVAAGHMARVLPGHCLRSPHATATAA